MRGALAQLERGDPAAEPDQAYRFALEVVQRAEAYGFHTTLIAERFFGPDLEAWTLASAMAALTSKIEVMVAVHPGIVSPQVVAKIAASLDRISGGRFAVNIVNGWWSEEFDQFSNGGWIEDKEQRYRRMREFVHVMKGLWTEEAFTFAGEFYRVDFAPALAGTNLNVAVPASARIATKPRRVPSPPIYAASRSGSGKEIIAQYCDVWFAEYRPGYRNFDENLDRIARDIREMDELAGRYGRKIRYGINPQVICADTLEEAHAEADRAESPQFKDRISNALGAGLVGTPEILAERIGRYREIGVDCLMMRFTPMLDGLERFASRVMPLL
jgi:FMNH2-dependent dimethyl sulfone monooxygenase